MSILSRILRLGSKGDASANEVRSQYYAPSRFAAHIGLGTKAGVGVTEEGALALSAVYSCVRLIASSLASIDLHLHRVEGAERQIASDHPVYQIVNSMPAEGMTAYDFFEHIISDALLHGQGYALIERGEVTGRPVQLHLLTADKMRKHNHEGQTVYTHADIPQHVFPDDLLIIRCFRGISPIRQHMEGIGLAMAAQEFASRYYGTGGNVGGVLSTDRALTNEQYERLRQSWQNTHGGLRNAHEVAILEHGLKYEPMTMNMAESEYIKVRVHGAQEVARIFQVPSSMIGLEANVSYNGAEHQDLQYVKHTLLPWCRRIEDEIAIKLLREGERGQIVPRFDLNSMLRADTTSRSEFYQKALQSGWMSINEVRAKEDMNPIGPEGDLHLVQVNQLPLNTIEGYGASLSKTEAEA
jgi:HK97 family phage portal protein